MQAPPQPQAQFYAQQQQQQQQMNPYAMWPQAMMNPYNGMYPGYMGAGYGAANAGADASAAVKAEAGKTGFDPAQLAQWQQTVAAQQRAQSGAAAAQTAAVASKAGGVGGVTNGTNGAPEMWMDERELKRQRRKQSNRESARRSRLRKQAECEELGGRVDALSTENITLRAELKRLKDACGSLETDNKTLADKLKVIKGDDVEAAAEGGKKTSPTKKGGKAADADGGKD